jgi:hypothetical protein
MTIRISPDGTGFVYMPLSPPPGIVFNDGSFLVFKQIFRYDYSGEATEPEIIYLEYSFHYQIPQHRFFFRYDFHPKLGHPLTHPAYHLHAGGWFSETDSLPAVPRFPVSNMTLGEVLELIRINFFLNR